MHLFQEQAARDLDAALAQIPIIDLGCYLDGKPEALEALAAEIKHACQTIGFFYIQNHGIPQDLIGNAFAQSARFHALPLESKLALSLDENNIGYMPMNASKQAHSTVHKATTPNQNESFFITHDRGPDHPDVLAGTDLRGHNYWPDGLLGFREGVMRYFAALNALGQSLVQPFSVALDMPADFLDDYFTEENNATLRMLHYPPTEISGNDFLSLIHI